MKGAGNGHFGVLHQGAQFVVGGILVEASGDAHRAQEGLLACITHLSEFHVKEAAIETGIMGDHYRTIDKAIQLGKNLVGLGRLVEHMISDAGVVLNKTVDLKTRLYQVLVLVCDLSVFKRHGADLNGAVTTVSRQAGGFKVQDDYSFLQERCFIGLRYDVISDGVYDNNSKTAEYSNH